MKIVSWNMGFWQHRNTHPDAWAYLREQIRPDIALLQEVCPPVLGDHERVVFQEIRNGWGTAVYLRELQPQAKIEFAQYPNRVAATSIYLPTGKLSYVASIHAPIINNRVFPHLANIVNDIEASFAGRASIVGGDLNTARSAEKKWPRYGHGPFWERMDRSWLADSRKAFQPEEVQTYFRSNQTYSVQDDHIFLSDDLAKTATGWEVINDHETRNVSDHIPVLVQLLI